jgi:hypothetical protein
MFEEPIEDRFNELLKKRVALEGELALSRRQSEAALAKARTKSKRYFWLMLLLPFLTFWYAKTMYIKPLEQKIALQSDLIVQLQNDIAAIKPIKKDSIRYVIRQGDMLVTLGKLFFNDPKAGLQIGLENGMTSDYQQNHLEPGDTLTIRYR